MLEKYSIGYHAWQKVCICSEISTVCILNHDTPGGECRKWIIMKYTIIEIIEIRYSFF